MTTEIRLSCRHPRKRSDAGRRRASRLGFGPFGPINKNDLLKKLHFVAISDTQLMLEREREGERERERERESEGHREGQVQRKRQKVREEASSEEEREGQKKDVSLLATCYLK